MANFYGDDDSEFQVDGFDNYYGGNGNDILKGAGGANELYGGAGNDLLAGGDAVQVVAPEEVLGAGTAEDPFRFTENQKPSGDDVLEGGSGNDGIYGFDGDDYIDGGSGNDAGRATAGTGAGIVYVGGLHGGAGDDEMYGGAGDDEMFGDADNDYMDGGSGNDVMDGGTGDDEIYGGGGDDEITGGLGQDDMYGGNGLDMFIFTSIAEIGKGSTSDYVGDFRSKQGDLIDLSLIDANENKNGDQKFKWIGEAKFTKAGQISFKNGKLKINTDNDKAAEAVILVNTNKMDDDDFVL